MSIHEVNAEELAKLFHIYRQALAHGLGDPATNDQAKSWDQVPQCERKLMVAAARLALIDLADAGGEEPPARSYFAKPGEANWGC